MADAHKNGNLLLEPLVLGSFLHSRRLGEDLDGIALARRLLDTEVNLGEVTLAEFLERGVLLQEGTC